MPNEHRITSSFALHFPWGRLTTALLMTLGAGSLGERCHMALGQEAKILMDQGPVYVGQPFLVRVVADGFQQDPQPKCDIDPVSDRDLNLEHLGATPQISVMIHSVNGRVTKTEKVVMHYTFQVVARRAGKKQLGPFRVHQGTREARTEPVFLDVKAIEASDELLIELKIPRTRLYQGEQLPVELRWGIAGNFNRLRNMSVQVPLFDEFTYFDAAPAQGDSTVRLSTRQGTVELGASFFRDIRHGKEFSLLMVRRELIADRVGNFNFDPPVFTAQIANRSRPRLMLDDFFADDLFGRREELSPPMRAEGQPLQVEVLPIPTVGRPASFSGAVGTGFSIETSVNRSVVRMGDPVALTIRISGPGNLTGLTLPDLRNAEGLTPEDFHVQDEHPPGVVAEGSKQFVVMIRATRESITEVPPISFSWFNPETEKFETSVSRPVALQVLPAQVIGARDVTRGTETPDLAATAPTTEPSNAEPSHASPQFSGLDLSIETDPAKLVSRESLVSRPWVARATYAVGVCLLSLALWQRRVRLMVPSRQREMEYRRHVLSNLARLQNRPLREAAGGLSELVRRVMAQSPPPPEVPVDRWLHQLEALAFAPQGSPASHGERELLQQVTEWIRAQVES